MKLAADGFQFEWRNSVENHDRLGLPGTRGAPGKCGDPVEIKIRGRVRKHPPAIRSNALTRAHAHFFPSYRRRGASPPSSPPGEVVSYDGSHVKEATTEPAANDAYILK